MIGFCKVALILALDRFVASFSAFAAFDNDERTRAFLGVEIGAGHTEVKRDLCSNHIKLNDLVLSVQITLRRFRANFETPSPEELLCRTSFSRVDSLGFTDSATVN